jgi:hypothetical protein
MSDVRNRIAQAIMAQASDPQKHRYINGEYASTPEELANDVRQAGVPIRTDRSMPAQRQLIDNLPPDIEQIPDPGGYIMLRVKPAPEEIPMS